MKYRGDKKVTLYHGNGQPRERYRNGVKIAGWHNETKSGDSASFPDTYNDTADIVLTGNTVGLVDAAGNIKSNDIVSGAFGALRKVQAVSDELICKTGDKTKRISDWQNLIGRPWTSNQFYTNSKRFVLQFSDAILGLFSFLCYKFNSVALVGGTTSSEVPDLAQIAGSNYLYVNVSNEDSGMGFYSNPTASEIRAYFYGWKMCNENGSSPYYKSELPYTASTWAEWSAATGVTKDAGGMEWTYQGLWAQSNIANTIKLSAKYGLIYQIVSNSTVYGLSFNGVLAAVSIPVAIGNNKLTIVSSSTTPSDFGIRFNNVTSEITGGKIKIKDIRVYELPTGSQIEADFNTLTADQLAIKYPFQGLCVKNWKHITDELGQTAVLPTASYEGYTPYKMLYQLAVPAVTQETPIIVPTHLGQTVISTDSIVKPTITAIAKVTD